MFDTLDMSALIKQALLVASWMQMQAIELRAQAWHQLWATSPWWFRLVMIAVTVIGSLQAARRTARRLGLRL